MKKTTITICLLLGLISNVSFADNEIACKAVLCLSGGLANEKGFAECVAPVATYANIRVYDHKKFNESLTAIARDSFIRQCSSADSGFISRITATYGPIENVNL